MVLSLFLSCLSLSDKQQGLTETLTFKNSISSLPLGLRFALLYSLVFILKYSCHCLNLWWMNSTKSVSDSPPSLSSFSPPFILLPQLQQKWLHMNCSRHQRQGGDEVKSQFVKTTWCQSVLFSWDGNLVPQSLTFPRALLSTGKTSLGCGLRSCGERVNGRMALKQRFATLSPRIFTEHENTHMHKK